MSLMLAQQVQALDYFVMFNLVIMLVFVKRQVFKNIFDTLIDMPLRAGEIFPLPPFETVICLITKLLHIRCSLMEILATMTWLINFSCQPASLLWSV